jgi:beta-N-acetylhexosaminidase
MILSRAARRYGQPVAPGTRLAAAATLALLAAAPLAGAGDPRRTDRAPARAAATPPAWAVAAAGRLATRQQVGQLVVAGFAGSRAPGSILSALRRGELSGVILFGANVASPAQLRRLTGSLQDAAGDGALISVDQEGGLVRRIPFAGPRPGQPDQGSVARVRRLAGAAAKGLRSLGLNVNFAPVTDVPSSPGSDILRRAFAGGPVAVAARVVAAIEGYRVGRVAATAKHFPGLGGAPRNTDDASVVIRRSPSRLRRADLVPFRAAVAARVPLIMVSHAAYPALDARRIASQSRRVIGGLLRGEMRYEGAVVTDALEATAVRRRSSVARAAERSLLAGCDLLLLTRPSSRRAVVRHLAARAAASRAVGIRVRDAVARVLALKRALGLRLAQPRR